MSARPTVGGAICIALGFVPAPALGQAVDDNVVTESDDAFGRSVGNQKSGLYKAEDVRGFSAIDAGNVRLEGLYFDLVGRLPRRLVDGSSIRIGLASRGYPFPAPTGLADYRLEMPGEDRVISLTVDTAGNSTRGLGGVFEFHLPIADQLFALSGGIGGRNSTRAEGGSHTIRDFGLLAAFRPAPDVGIVAFSGGIIRLGAEARATYFPTEGNLPPKIRRRKFLGQKWTGQDRRNFAHGGLVRAPVGAWRLEAGLFYSRRGFRINFSDLLLGVAPDGSVANRVVIAEPDELDESLSGEVRLVRKWNSGSFNHAFTASIRGRKKHRRFGGSDRISLGPSAALEPDFRPEPAFAFGQSNQDDVRQLTAGLAFSSVWKDKASIDVGLSKSRYRKIVSFADPDVVDPVTRDRPWLWNVGASLNLTRHVTVYGGITRGQEEALIAPAIAENRSEAPPAIRTKQLEAGLAVKLGEDLSLVAGVFTISKPYFNLDPDRLYRQLGKLNNRGIEISLAGKVAPGLSIIAGTILIDPRIKGEAVEVGLIGKRPVGRLRRRSVLNLDWRMQGGTGAWSFDLAVESFSSRIANVDNSSRAPAFSTVKLGARFRFDVAGSRFVIRPQILNLFNSYGWEVSSSGGFKYSNPRTALIKVIADFY